MDFGYFTLSDNHYENNTRSSNQFVADITAEALLADKLGMHSAWIGEHHFNSLGVLSCPTSCSVTSPPTPRASGSRRR
jgi:alkanesulfonate monooxygenase SsuD/methylene tetrahydromethanopterin reductase-like flavin-dependent oxidoreductase (luciferase family)